jgi:hypothetical protein
MIKVTFNRAGWDGRTVKRWLGLALLFFSLLLLPNLGGLGQAQCPTIAVIIPEICIIREIVVEVPDPAAETAIIHRFLEYGFHVVDQAQVKFLRMTDPEIIKRAREGDLTAIRQLSERFVADILVLGEAISEVEVTRLPGQPTLQEGRARVELRAIESATGKILAADARHTGGIDFGAELACKKSLQRSGDKIACKLAKEIAQNLSPGCFRDCKEPLTTCGVTPFENQSGFRVRGWDVGQGLATMVETALSKRGLTVSRPLAADIVVTGVVSDWEVKMTPWIPIPLLDLLFRAGIMEMTVDLRLLDLGTAEIRADVVTDSVTGFEVLGIRFGLNPRGLARKIAQQIADRAVWLSRGR